MMNFKPPFQPVIDQGGGMAEGSPGEQQGDNPALVSFVADKLDLDEPAAAEWLQGASDDDYSAMMDEFEQSGADQDAAPPEVGGMPAPGGMPQGGMPAPGGMPQGGMPPMGGAMPPMGGAMPPIKRSMMGR